MSAKLVPGLLVLLFAPFLCCQQFARVGREAVPRTSGSGRTFLLDLDGDQAIDIYFRRDLYWHNDGHGRFTERPLTVVPGLPGLGLAVGDFDGDGDADAVTTGAVLHNRGMLGPVWTATALAYPHSPIAAGDFDGDQKTDLVTLHGVAMALSLTTFQEIGLSGATGTITEDAAVADIDGDGDLDVVRGSSGGTSQWPPYTFTGNRFVWRNDGGGTWTTVAAFLNAPAVGDAVQDIVAFDADGDTDVDVGFLRGSGWEFWRNTGSGFFTVWPGLIQDGLPLEAIDFDRDGDPDLVGSRGWHENRGLGSFTWHELPGSHFYLRENYRQLHAIGDLNGDQELDLVFGRVTTDPTPAMRFVLLNEGGAREFTDVGAFAWQSSLSRPLAIGDVDGDGYPDLHENSSIGGILWRNGGDGWFKAAPGPDLIQMIDLDGDGDLDALAGNRAALNDGTGTFSAYASLPFVLQGQVQGQHGFDADGDGDNDLAYLDATGLVLMRNLGSLVFAAGTPVALSGGGVDASAAADFDGDGDVDVLVGSASPVSVALLRNDGTGTFAIDPAGIVGFGGTSKITDLPVADLDGDGDRDVLVGRSLGTNPQHVVLRNLSGVLTADPAAAPAHSGPTQVIGSGATVQLGDVDGDGDADAVVLVEPNPAPRLHLWRNDGTGRFPVVEDLGLYWIDPVLFADVDLDGDADLFAGSQLFLSRQWHSEAPFVLQIGTTYVFRCGGRAMPNALVVPFLGTRANLQLPGVGGTVALDPLTAVSLGSMFLSGEMAEVSVVVPTALAFLGFPVSFQAVLLSNGALHVTPAKHEVIRS